MAPVHWELLDRLARAQQLEPRSDTEGALDRFLKKWWCMTYNRPFKDPLLTQYTLDELAYEFLSHHYARNDPREAMAADKRKAQDEEWIRRQLDLAAAQAAAQVTKPPEPPTPAPAAPPNPPPQPEPPSLETSVRFDT